MNRDRVLVALDREAAETRVFRRAGSLDEAINANHSLDDALRAALDTDREELVKAIARELYQQGVQFEGFFTQRAAHAEDTAGAVLALLENGGSDE